jgi:heat-inducible transcriptional repressor
LLSERKSAVLKHTVTDFVHTNVPVSSERLARAMGCSSASIRNEMYLLTEMGYLTQPHVSAGRVPTDEGYRFFVDNLLEEMTLGEEDEAAVVRGMDVLQLKLDQLFRDMTEIIASCTECIGFVCVPQLNRSALRRIEVSEVSPRCVLLLVVLCNGMVENRLVELPVDVGRLPLETISRMLNERLSGRPLQDIGGTFLDEVFTEVRLFEEGLRDMVKRFIADLVFSTERRLYVEGTREIIRQPEFQDARRLRPVLEVVRAEPPYAGLLDVSDGRFNVSIGRENSAEELRDCSVVKSHFSMSDSTVGSLGIIGPKRMDYGRLAALLRYLSDALSQALRHIPIS